MIEQAYSVARRFRPGQLVPGRTKKQPRISLPKGPLATLATTHSLIHTAKLKPSCPWRVHWFGTNSGGTGQPRWRGNCVARRADGQVKTFASANRNREKQDHSIQFSFSVCGRVQPCHSADL